MIQNNIRYPFHTAVTGDSDGRQRHMMINGRVHGYEAFDASVQEKVRIGVEKLGVVAVRHGQEKEVLLPEVSFYSADDQRTIKVTNLLGDNSNHVGAFYPQVAGVETRPVVQLASRGEDALLCVQGYG